MKSELARATERARGEEGEGKTFDGSKDKDKAKKKMADSHRTSCSISAIFCMVVMVTQMVLEERSGASLGVERGK